MSGPDTGLTRSRASSFRLAPDEVHCWCVRLDVPPETSARLHATLSADERSRIARLRFPRDQQHFIVAHGALRQILGRYLQTEPGRINFVYNEFGKPDLGPEFGGRLKFNLSHSAGLALIAIAAESDVGVDLEHIRTESDYTEIARRFFSAAEVDQLSALPEPLYAGAFLRCWTKKEACLKACGGGLTIPLNRVAVPLTADPAQGPEDICVASSDIARATRWSVHSLRPAPGFVGALAIEGGGWRLIQWRWAPGSRSRLI